MGDKYVVKEMLQGDYVLGGEQSGHIVCLEHSTTGDGCIAALSVLAAMKSLGKSLADLNDLFIDAPQVLINSRITRKVPFDQIPGYQDMVAKYTKELGAAGRIFVRYSGTEPKVRVLVEGEQHKQINSIAEDIISLLQKELA